MNNLVVQNINMKELPMCRVCLAEDIRLRLIANTHLQEMYESLTLLPLETKDSRPLGVCYICLAGLQNCYRLRKRCLRSDELLTHMLSSAGIQTLNVQKDCTQRLTVMHPAILLSTGDKLQNKTSTEDSAHRTDAPDVLSTVQQQDNEDMIIKMEPQEEYDAQLEDDIQCSLLEDPLDITKRKPDDVVTGDCVKTKSKIAALRDTEDATSKRKTEVEKNKDTENITFKEPKIVTKKTRVEKPLAKSKILKTCDKIVDNVCEKKSTNNTSLGHHVSSVSISNKKEFFCDTCKKCFSRKKHLKAHFLIHTGEKPHECHVCKKRFIQKSTLTKHIRTHTGEKPYKCNYCNKCFVSKSTLNAHIRSHTGEKIATHTRAKPYQCNYCKKCFTKNATLQVHIRSHTGEKPYQCSLCNKRFNQISNLNHHIRKHTGEKPFMCHICEKCFNQNGTLKRHIRIHTG